MKAKRIGKATIRWERIDSTIDSANDWRIQVTGAGTDHITFVSGSEDDAIRRVAEVFAEVAASPFGSVDSPLFIQM